MDIILNMRLIPRVVLLAPVLWIWSSPTVAQTVRVKWERATDFSEYQTYHWIEGTHAKDDRNHRIIVDAVDAQMSINGIFTDELEPELYAVYHASAESSFGIEGGYKTDWTDAGAIEIKSHIAGTLVVDLVDAARNQVVWRGIATGSVAPDPKKNRRTVQEAMKKMFASFPPPPPKNR